MPKELSDMELFHRKFNARKSTVQTRRQHAVCVRDACKNYGSKKNPIVVLEGLNMTVPKGMIYGLLGASGCGKTTLLTCIVGRKKLDSGEIWVLGGRPGSRGSGVPGPRIGYMPQDIAQYGEFTIRETLKFYGWVAGMKTHEVEDRTDFLVQMLMLPNADQTVKTLSLGQQRRVSLASALLHEPELLILDEPTVGVDPLLREIIWNHFVDITRSEQTTIIITTHYIDETRQADLIGLMRGGSFLAEESPEKLMRQMNVDSLEDVFLKLSLMQNMNRRRRSILVREVTNVLSSPSGIVNKSPMIEELNSDDTDEVAGEFGDNVTPTSSNRRASMRSLNEDDDDEENTLPELPPQMEPPMELTDYLRIWGKDHMKALIWKNFLWMSRNLHLVLLIIALPAVQIVIFCTCIGHDPTYIPVAVVNHETNANFNCDGPLTCNSTELSCHYLKQLEKRTLILKYYESEDIAKASVLTGKTYASIIMQHNYSSALQARIRKWDSAKPWDIINSNIDVLPDKSNKAVSIFLAASFLETFRDFIKNYLEACELDGRILKEPVQWQPPIYGANRPDFTGYIMPGILVSLSFTLGACLTAFVVFTERLEGTFQRYLVAGISEIELLSSHFMCEFVICLLQEVLAMLVAFLVFRGTLQGSAVLATVLIVLCGICGMGFGFCISCLCDNERAVNNLILGSFVPIVTLSGVLWPVEGMHYILQWIAPILPITQPTESLRSVMERGWDISEYRIYTGVITLCAWTVVFMTLSVLTVKYKKS